MDPTGLGCPGIYLGMEDRAGEIESVDKDELCLTGLDFVGVRIGTGREPSVMIIGLEFDRVCVGGSASTCALRFLDLGEAGITLGGDEG